MDTNWSLPRHQQALVTVSGYWPLFRYNPEMRKVGTHPCQLGSPRPTIPLKDYAYNETRYSSLADTDAKSAVDLLEAA